MSKRKQSTKEVKSKTPDMVRGDTFKTPFEVQTESIPDTAKKVRDVFIESGDYFERAKRPVKIVFPADGSLPEAVALTPETVVSEVHERFQPYKHGEAGRIINITLPAAVARQYLKGMATWGLKPLDGITTAPILKEDGSIRTAQGYDPSTRLWCWSVPEVNVPDKPTLAQAKTALMLCRETYKSFPFIDSPLIEFKKPKLPQVDLSKKPGAAESAFLIGLMTAVCRQSLWLSPGLVLRAASLSGAGTGKGLLVRSICSIAYGYQPPAVTSGHSRSELDKRLSTALMSAAPAVLLDNVNLDVPLRNNTLASALTERPAEVRIFGVLRQVPLNCTAFIAITGNGLRLSEDLVRRFITCDLDAKCEDPEARPFERGFLKSIDQRRGQLLSALLTIWRFGRQQKLDKGEALGSYEDWAAWVRDPLLALGCQDPVQSIKEMKAFDPERQKTLEIFDIWWEQYKDKPTSARPMTAKQLWDGMYAPEREETMLSIAKLIKSNNRQEFTSWLDRHVNTFVGGYVLTRTKTSAKWNTAKYILTKQA